MLHSLLLLSAKLLCFLIPFRAARSLPSKFRLPLTFPLKGLQVLSSHLLNFCKEWIIESFQAKSTISSKWSEQPVDWARLPDSLHLWALFAADLFLTPWVCLLLEESHSNFWAYGSKFSGYSISCQSLKVTFPFPSPFLKDQGLSQSVCFSLSKDIHSSSSHFLVTTKQND